MSKRISALVLAFLLVACSVLNGNTLKVKAASATVAMSPELAAEFYLFLYQLTETAMHVGGANNGLDSKEAMVSLRDGVIGYYSVSGEKNIDFEIQTTDGRTFKSYSSPEYRGGLVEYTTADGQTYKLSGDKFFTLLLNGTITLDPDIYNDTDEEPTVNDDDEYVKNMKAMFDAKWEELREIGFKDDSGDPTPSPSPDPEKNPFKNIALVTVGASLVALAGAFVKDLLYGKVEGIDSNYYFEGLGFRGTFDQDVDGNYILLGSTVRFEKRFNQTRYQTYSLNNADPVACYMSFTKSDFDGDYYSGTFLSYNSKTSKFYYPRFFCPYTYVPSGSLKDNDNYYNTGTNQINTYNFNFPVFSTKAQAEAFLQNGDLSGLLNGEVYDFPELTKSVPTVMQPLTGYEFAPGRLRNVNQALADAATKVQPETGTDTAAATKTYTQTMTDTMTEVAPKPQVVPQPSTTPGTETGEGTEGEAYKRDLRLIFPFCIPFDFIHFIKALSADPVAPCFKIPIKLDSLGIDMVLELDLAWMDPVMEIFRLGELGCFVIMLMAATKKMIGW